MVKRLYLSCKDTQKSSHVDGRWWSGTPGTNRDSSPTLDVLVDQRAAGVGGLSAFTVMRISVARIVGPVPA